MAKKSKPRTRPLVPITMVNEAQNELMNTLASDPEYLPIADPTGALKLSDVQKKFIATYIDYHNVAYASTICEIDEKEGRAIFNTPVCRAEIRRINRALYQRQFSNRLLRLDELGGYLSALLMDEVPEYAQLESKDKLKLIPQIIEIIKLKADSFNNPARIVEYSDIEKDINELDVSNIKSLINSMKNKDVSEESERKKELIGILNGSGDLDITDQTYLQTLSVDELKSLVEETVIEKKN